MEDLNRLQMWTMDFTELSDTYFNSPSEINIEIENLNLTLIKSPLSIAGQAFQVVGVQPKQAKAIDLLKSNLSFWVS